MKVWIRSSDHSLWIYFGALLESAYGLCRNSNERFFDIAFLLSFCSMTKRFLTTANGVSSIWTSSVSNQRLAKLAIEGGLTLDR
jgi:hypothetical protein